MLKEDALVKKAAASEGVDVNLIRSGLQKGTIVIPYNRKRPRVIEPLGIGKGMLTKVNANIGTSPSIADVDNELAKLKAAEDAGADTVMDLSTGGDINHVRKEIIKASRIPVGTVPIYQAAVDSPKLKKSFAELTVDEIFSAIRRHLEDGVDFITVHTGITREGVERLRNRKRLAGIVSRGGSMMVGWMAYNKKENPLAEYFGRLVDLTAEFGACLSLGDGLRPGALRDASDRAQIQELLIIGEQVDAARAKGVQVMVEGPGHVPIDQIQMNVKIQKEVCHGTPFYVLGPLVTDVAPGYDHIVSAIGGAVAGMHGADFLCYVTPSEHLGLPNADDVRVGTVVSKIAAHAADIAKYPERTRKWDEKVSRLREEFKWEEMIKASIDPGEAERKFSRYPKQADGVCTMCGEYCAIKRSKEALEALGG
ncbi:phosphomethylpyrimidine synthase ThiC [candidate division WOR-3 bacterium]|uniref:Phosphomethylpyrimidine synthase n=1 Tax=candidate division WOR-3 bacterium TaxID=2052148 RepID=A0A9D5QCB6_UNCW3|nr:phosphomethylpyrimidine synthase ThiC [candidate division WOR-3 bacterium]MBD3364498.1 phosphomethylpyrimidine synthase ThiC [candidate division WOR-3 bacterium]